MPVKKAAPKKRATKSSARKPKAAAAPPIEPPMDMGVDHDCCFAGPCSMPFMQEELASRFGRKILWTLVGVLLVYGVVLLGTMIRNNLEAYHYIGQAEKQERTITIEAEGKVTAKPDVAMTSMGMSAEGETVVEAQEENSRVMNELITKLKGLGIEDADIQTANYNVFPRYEYSDDNERVLRGYQVSQNVTVKIRNVDNANAVLALAGEVGANNVSGIDFTLDDSDVYVQEARTEALKKLQEKAEVLAQMLGVRVVGLVSYDEFESGSIEQPYASVREAYGMGGGAPKIESGSTDVVMTVRAVLEIK